MKKLYPWQNEPWQRWVGLRSRLPHAILLKGSKGIGKFDFAMNLAQSLLCMKPNADGLACHDCSSCNWFAQATHPDFRLLQPGAMAVKEVDNDFHLWEWTRRVANEAIEEEQRNQKKPSKEIVIFQVRDINSFINQSAHQGGMRVVVVYPAEAMNVNSANALLKNLEEPTKNLLFLLVSDKPQQLLPTILSRCLTIAMPMPTLEESTAWLNQQGVSNPAAMLAQAGFAPLQAVRIAEEAAGSDEYNRFLQAIRQPAKFDVFALAEQLQKTEPAKVIHWLQQWCYDLSSIKLAGKVRYNTELYDAIKNLADKLSMFDLMRFQKELIVARREASHSLNAKLQFESILLSYRQMMLAGQ